MLLLILGITVTLGAYALAYRSLLSPEICLYAAKSGLFRLRHERYRRGGRILELFFAPIAFVDFMIREKYWMQRDVAAIQIESPELAIQLPLIERIGLLGGLVVWRRGKVTVSFLRRAIPDDALVVLEEFVIVDDLDLASTGVSDAGLEHLKKLDRLRHLNLTGTRASDVAIERLQLALPKCRIWTGK